MYYSTRDRGRRKPLLLDSLDDVDGLDSRLADITTV